jgi:hypothetical protein
MIALTAGAATVVPDSPRFGSEMTTYVSSCGSLIGATAM